MDIKNFMKIKELKEPECYSLKELREMCKEYKIPKYGTKKVIISRINKYYNSLLHNTISSKPTNYNFIVSKKSYSVHELRNICQNLNISKQGNKTTLINKINRNIFIHKFKHIFKSYIQKFRFHKYLYTYLPKECYKHKSQYSIQKWKQYRTSLIQKCSMKEDFFTLDTLEDETWYNVIFYKENNTLYMFHIDTLYEYLFKHNHKTNPYTRKQFHESFIERLQLCYKYRNEYLNIYIEEHQMDDMLELTFEQKIRNICILIDQYTDYITNSHWFLNLNMYSWKQFLFVLYDIWNYRIPMTEQLRLEISPHRADPFYEIRPQTITQLFDNEDYDSIKTISSHTIECYIKNCITEDARYCAITHILCALTTVSHDAATALPYLYFSVIE